MSFSDLTRSYTTFPSLSPTFTSSPRPSPVSPSSTAQTGASNIPGYSIAAGETTRAPASAVTSAASVGSVSAAGGGGRVDEGLALGLGLGLGLAALIAVLAAVFVVRQRKAQREEFDRRAEGIKATMSQVQASITLVHTAIHLLSPLDSPPLLQTRFSLHLHSRTLPPCP